jgi:tRNA threonylcarbamoyladenosine biosynthesis protein TsaE
VSPVELLANGAEQMRAIGARLARALADSPRDQSLLLTLSGDLGAGKTTLVGGLIAAMGHAGAVRSPTYTLIEPYRLRDRDVLHCDLYRLRHPDELDDLGLRDLRVPGSLLLVEWPEKAEGKLGPVDLELTLSYATPEARTLRIAAPQTAAGQSVLSRFTA